MIVEVAVAGYFEDILFLVQTGTMDFESAVYIAGTRLSVTVSLQPINKIIHEFVLSFASFPTKQTLKSYSLVLNRKSDTL